MIEKPYMESVHSASNWSVLRILILLGSALEKVKTTSFAFELTLKMENEITMEDTAGKLQHEKCILCWSVGV